MIKITEKLKVVLKSLLDVKMGEMKTDKAVLIWDGDAELAVGMEVFVLNEDGEVIPAADGEYLAEDGSFKTIIVEGGKVTEIKVPDTPVEDEPSAEPEGEGSEENVLEVKNAEDEEVEPADEPETEEEPEASDAERITALEEKMNEMVIALNEIVNAIASLEGRIAEVEGKVAKVEAPAADPIDETPIEEEKKTRLSYLRRK